MMKKLLIVLMLWLPLPAAAGTTNIAQLPLLNIDGTGSVKPNLMLLFDNSTSMDYAYTPDHVNDALCRKYADLSSADPISCTVGHPPFMSADFNKQYYDPKIRYAPPIKADGSFYSEMNAANTTNWTVVTGDGFGARSADMFGRTITNTNLVTGFPDLNWCDDGNPATCRSNTATYNFPNRTYYVATSKSANPYYYNIGVAEYCTDDAMKVCKSTSVGAPAPAGYPVPAKVRWCNSTALSNCQAKRVGDYIYPRYSTVLGATASYGTIAIGASSSASSLRIDSVTIPDPTFARTITNGAVTATTGTDTPAKQRGLASALAASIIAKTGLATQYWACVNNPVGAPSVPACSAYGITLGADNIVAVIPIACSGSKSASNCSIVNDSSRAGWGISVSTQVVTLSNAVVGVPPTALIVVSGTVSNSSSQTYLSNAGYKGATLVTNIALAKSGNSAAVAKSIADKIGTTGNIKAYVGGNSTTVCKGVSSSTVCVVESNGSADGGMPSVGTLNNTSNSTLAFALRAATGYVPAAAAVTDSIPIQTTALSAPSTFSRVDIVDSRATYPLGIERTDCVSISGYCSYAEEMTNFANWYAYYKTRMQMMKSSVGVAFAPLTSSYRVGFAKLSVIAETGPVDIKPTEFNASARTAWYDMLYQTTTSGSTPIRPAMNNIGKMFANQGSYKYDPGEEVVQYACQQNFMILTTDGYWNGSTVKDLPSNDNLDNPARFCTAASGCVDKRVQGEPSIADVALYWYNGGSATGTVSLRPALEPYMNKPGLVTADAGENTHLHMTTYTLGLGVDGIMSYDPDYDTAKIKVGGDFYNLISGVKSGCPWNNNGPYVWPDPVTGTASSGTQARVDDLWHAAVNGHGKYFSASDPKQVVAGLSEAITKLQVKVGAAAAAATSTPNISQEDRDIFSTTFTTVRWYGELTDRYIDTVSGVVVPDVRWSTSDQLGKQVASNSDERVIKWRDPVSGLLKNFIYSALGATEQAWFANKCGMLAQCTLLSAANRDIANSGVNLVNWLRGQQQYANDTIFRSYFTPALDAGSTVTPVPIVLGDIASAKPAYLYDARKGYLLDGYPEFRAASLSRTRTLFAAANDGMLHAFYAPNSADAVNASKPGGKEIWAYVPRMTMKKLAVQASTTYGTNHQFTVDGSPELGDVKIGDAWKTVLVAGLNGGGRGYYALDVTAPENPQPLWELCADSAICSRNDPDIGLTFGNPQFGMWNNKWVVYLTSGYNNVPGVDGVAGGTGQGFLYIVDVSNGAVLKKVATGAGSVDTPSGLARITAITQNPANDPVTTYIYGGDNQGQMWRFDLTDNSGVSVPVLKMGDAGATQPITARPDVTSCRVNTTAADGSVTSSAQRVVAFGTGRLLDVSDVTNKDVQSLYLLKDSGVAVTDVRGDDMVEQTLSRIGTSGVYNVTSNTVDLSRKAGWYLDWKLNDRERMNLDPKIVSGALNVVTNIPSAESTCTVGGTSNVYQFDVCSGTWVRADRSAGEALSNTSAAVGFIIIVLPSGDYKMVGTTTEGKMITKAMSLRNPVGAHKVGWRRVKE